MIEKILIIIISVSIFGILLFVYVKKQIRKRVEYYLQKEKEGDKNL